MTTYYSDAYDGNNNPKSHKYHATGAYTVTASAELTADLVTSDLFKMVPVPKGARVKEVILACDTLDTSNGIYLDVGDTDSTDDTDRYISSATIGRGGGLTRLGKIAGFDYEFTADGSIDVLVSVAPQTATNTGTIRMVAFLANDDAP